MNVEMKERCDLLVKNRECISKAFHWESGMMLLTAASIFTESGKLADVEELKNCERIIKTQTSLFSSFRENAKMPLICYMALSEDPEDYFLKVQEVYQLLKAGKWSGNDYIMLAAMAIVNHARPAEYIQYVADTQVIFSRMKEDHKWLTSGEDIPFAAMLAVSDLVIPDMMDEAEKNYDLLSKSFHDKNVIQSLSHVLAINDADAAVKCERVKVIYNRLKDEKHKYASGFEMAVLGSMLITGLSDEEIVSGIIEADEYLRGEKGFGNFTLGGSLRRMYAAQTILDVYRKNDDKAHTEILGSSLAVTIAAEICMILIITSVASSAVTNA